MKLIILIIVVVFGALITNAIDVYLGIDFSKYSAVVRVAHNVSHMMQGAVFVWAVQYFKKPSNKY